MENGAFRFRFSNKPKKWLIYTDKELIQFILMQMIDN
jgi:hypothetical protein